MKGFVGSDEKLDNAIKNCKEFIAKMDDFKLWFDQQEKVTKKQVIEKAYKTIGSDWRVYTLKQAKKSELAEKVLFIYNRTIPESKATLEELESEKSKRVFKRLEIEQINDTAKPLREILNDYLKTNSIPDRELGCLIQLIDDGDITTKEELAEYGVEAQ